MGFRASEGCPVFPQQMNAFCLWGQREGPYKASFPIPACSEGKGQLLDGILVCKEARGAGRGRVETWLLQVPLVWAQCGSRILQSSGITENPFHNVA